MTDEKRESNEEQSSDYVRGGKGRRDEVGPTGIYPSDVEAPEGAEPRTPGEFGHRDHNQPRGENENAD